MLKKTNLRKYPKELPVKILDLSLQYFWRYDLRDLGILNAPDFHLKQVAEGKSS